VAKRRYLKLHREPLKKMDHWLNTLRSMWENRMSQLDNYLQQIQKEGKK
jgi:hypothetical protein